MDARRFDELARALAVASGTHPTARRSALRLLVGAGLAALTRLGAVGALAQDCSEPAQPCPNCCDGLNCGAGNLCCIPTLSTKKCRKPLHCCTGVCKKKKGKPTGTCICRKLDQPCTAGRNCCSERCGRHGKCLAPCG